MTIQEISQEMSELDKLRVYVKRNFDLTNLKILTNENSIEEFLYKQLIEINKVFPFYSVIGVFNGLSTFENSNVLLFDSGLLIEGFYNNTDFKLHYKSFTMQLDLGCFTDSIEVVSNAVKHFFCEHISHLLENRVNPIYDCSKLTILAEKKEQYRYVHYCLEILNHFFPFEKVIGVWETNPTESNFEHCLIVQFDTGNIIKGYNKGLLGNFTCTYILDYNDSDEFQFNFDIGSVYGDDFDFINEILKIREQL
jgi:hypothetical protein